MSLSVIQSKSATVSSGTTDAITFTSSVTAGSLIVANVATANTTDSVSNVKDNVNNTNFTLAVSKTGTSPGNTYQYYFPNSASGTMTVTVTYTAGLTGGDAFWIYEVGGAATSSPVDVTGSSNGTNTNVTSGNITTNNANDILIGVCNLGGSVSSSEGGWTNITNNGDGSEYIIESSTVTAAATWVQSPSSAYVAIIGSYKAASGSTVNLGSVTMSAALGIKPAPVMVGKMPSVTMTALLGIKPAPVMVGKMPSVTMSAALGIVSATVGKILISAGRMQANLGIMPAPTLTGGTPAMLAIPYSMWGGGF